MFLFCWCFDFLCKFKIFNEPWYIDKRSFLLYFAYFFSSKLKNWSLKLAYASQFMQNMAVDSLIEKIKTKIIIKFHFINFMIYLARVANSMVFFSASYATQPSFLHCVSNNPFFSECVSHNPVFSECGHTVQLTPNVYHTAQFSPLCVT